MKKIINFFRFLFRAHRLKKRGINYNQLKELVDCAKFLELNSRSPFEPYRKYIVKPTLDLTQSPDFSEIFEVSNGKNNS